MAAAGADLQAMDNKQLREEVLKLQSQLEQEKRRSSWAAEELRVIKERNLETQKLVEQEEEFITNKLMKRLEQLKREKQTLANEVEQEEEYLINNLQKRLNKLSQEKEHLETQLESEQSYIVNKLQKKLAELTLEKHKLNLEKVQLENQLEAEQEYIVNKLQKQVARLGQEKSGLQKERSMLQRTVTDLAGSVDRMNKDKVQLENAMEMEEEGIVNRLNRQLTAALGNLKALEQKLEARGISLKELGVLPYNTMPAQEWVYGRSPRSSDSRAALHLRRDASRPLSASSTGSGGSLPQDNASRAELLHATLRANSSDFGTAGRLGVHSASSAPAAAAAAK